MASSVRIIAFSVGAFLVALGITPILAPILGLVSFPGEAGAAMLMLLALGGITSMLIGTALLAVGTGSKRQHSS